MFSSFRVKLGWHYVPHKASSNARPTSASGHPTSSRRRREQPSLRAEIFCDFKHPILLHKSKTFGPLSPHRLLPRKSSMQDLCLPMRRSSKWFY